MLKIFRKIRKEYLFKGKLGTYFAYTLGEIFLVVVGILIALQINTWNQGRINNKKQTEYLERLETDVTADLENYKTFKSFSQVKLVVLKSILQGTYDSIKVHDLSGTYDLFLTRFNSIPLAQDNAIEDMKSTGGISLMKDAKIRDALFSYYRFVDNRTQALEGRFGNWNYELSKLIPGEEEIVDTSIEGYIKLPEVELQKIIRILKESVEELRPYINAEIQYTIKQEVSFYLLANNAEDLLSIIAEELCKRKGCTYID